MLRSIGSTSAVIGCLLLLAAPPAHAQLATSGWPKQFHDDANQGRATDSTTTGPTTTAPSVLASVTGLGAVSDPVVGPDGTVYFTYGPGGTGTSVLLYAYTYNSATKVLTQSWSLSITGVGNMVSAPTIDKNGYAWLGTGAAGKDAFAVRVDLTNHTYTSLDFGHVNQAADDQPPAIDSDGTVYFATHTTASGTSAFVNAVTGGSGGLTLKSSVGLIANGNGVAPSNPVYFCRFALKDGGVGGTHTLLVHALWPKYPIPTTLTTELMKLTYQASTGTFATVYDTADPSGYGTGQLPAPCGFPVLSADSSVSYYYQYVASGYLANAQYLYTRSTGSSPTVGHSVAVSGGAPAAVAIGDHSVSVPQVLSLADSLRECSYDLATVNNTWTNAGYNAPSVDYNGNWYFVTSDGHVHLFYPSSGTPDHSVSTSAKGEPAILKLGGGSFLVVRTSSGIEIVG